MTRIGVVTFLAQRLRHVPRSAWIAAGFALVLIPVLLLWLLVALAGGAWQAGGTLLGQGREVLQAVLPEHVGELARELPPGGALEALQGEAQQRLQMEVDRLQSAIPTATEAVQQELAGVALPAATEGLRQLTQQGRATADEALASLLGRARPATDVGGEDPPGVERLPGFVRTAFFRDGDRLKVSWSGSAPYAEVVAFYTRQLGAAGYRAQVLQATANSEVVSFESPQRRLTLSASADGRSGSEIHWEVR